MFLINKVSDLIDCCVIHQMTMYTIIPTEWTVANILVVF